MNDDTHIIVSIGELDFLADKGVLLIPEAALETQSYVRPITHGAGSSGKHTAFALARIAAEQYGEEALKAETVPDGVTVSIVKGRENGSLENGVLVAWGDDALRLWAFDGADIRALLKVAERETTRWIRLDVR